MSTVTLESVDHALTVTRGKYFAAIEAGEFSHAAKILERLDELLDQRCAATK